MTSNSFLPCIEYNAGHAAWLYQYSLRIVLQGLCSKDWGCNWNDTDFWETLPEPLIKSKSILNHMPMGHICTYSLWTSPSLSLLHNRNDWPTSRRVWICVSDGSCRYRMFYSSWWKAGHMWCSWMYHHNVSFYDIQLGAGSSVGAVVRPVVGFHYFNGLPA